MDDILLAAQAEHVADLERLEHMSEDEFRYLAEAESLDDPDTDGIEGECI